MTSQSSFPEPAPSHERAPTVVAVFGSKNHLEVAAAIGQEVGGAGHVLLTGGGLGTRRPAVRESAMDGARTAQYRGLPGRRVGVLGIGDDRPIGSETTGDGTQILLRLGYGHRRNYVEACLCDVAIAIDGEAGTKSEVAFCLALGRPVILVGPGWQGSFPLVSTDEAFAAFVDTARSRVAGNGQDLIDRQITAAYARLPRRPEGIVHRALDSPAKGLVALAVDRPFNTGGGYFPAVPQDREGVASAYHDWLADLQ